MDFWVWMMLAAIGVHAIKSRDQARRIAFLALHLGAYSVERLMEQIMQGYMRALGETDAERQEQVWQVLNGPESALVDEMRRFASAFARVDAAAVPVSTLPLALPWADRLLPRATFDLRQALTMHAQGIERAAQSSQPARDRAYTLMAELLLLQHTCHWYCRSRSVASARLLARHRTTHDQVLAAVTPQTRAAYRDLTGI